jgi:hypothetical protein
MYIAAVTNTGLDFSLPNDFEIKTELNVIGITLNIIICEASIACVKCGKNSLIMVGIAIEKTIEEITAASKPITMNFFVCSWAASLGSRKWNKLNGITDKNKRN